MSHDRTVVRSPDDFDPNEFHRVSDMALVAWLKMEGHTPQGCHWDSGTCHWIFRISEDLRAAVDEFTAGNARVEPKEYNRVFGATKREFHNSNPDDQRR